MATLLSAAGFFTRDGADAGFVPTDGSFRPIEDMDLFAASLTVLREVMGLLCMGALIIVGVLVGLAGVIVTFRDRLDGWTRAGEEGMMGFGRADEMVLGLVPIGAAIDDLDAILPLDDFELAGAAGFTGVLRPGVITAR